MMALNEGVFVDQYRIIRKLGSGGMADVYEAEETDPERRVALKVLPKWRAHNEEIVQRFRREARSAASMNHRGIVPIYKVGHDAALDVYYISMRLLTGGDLSARINAGMSAGEALMTVRELADAFQHAHARGLIHRDVKPSNVLFDEQGFPVLTDFGIAKALNAEGLTAPGQAMGTPTYMSPEQWQGKPADARSDLYALGVMLFEMISGYAPFAADSSAAVMFKHLTAPVPALPAQFCRLEPLVRSLMAKNPDDRPAGASELIKRIDLLMGITGPVTPLGYAARRPSDPGLLQDLQQRTSGKRQVLNYDAPADPTPIASGHAEHSGGSVPSGATLDASATRSATAASRKKRRLQWASAIVAAVLTVGGASGWYVAERAREVAEAKAAAETQARDEQRRKDEEKKARIDLGKKTEADRRAEMEKQKLDAERARLEASRDADEKARRRAERIKGTQDAEEQARRDGQIQKERETDEKLKQEAAQRQADEKAKLDATAANAEQEKRAAIEKTRREAEEKDKEKRDADARRAERDAAEKKRLDAETKARHDALEREKRERELMDIPPMS